MIVPCEKERLPLFLKTLEKYQEFGPFPVKLEILIPTRTIKTADFFPAFSEIIKILPYEWSGKFFNPAKAFNLGVKNSKYNNLLICSPEIRPVTNVLEQFSKLQRNNYLCQAFDLNKDGKRIRNLLKGRWWNPGFYFLALYKKEDIETINGWDEDFMLGNCYDDGDFGLRFLRAKLTYEKKPEIIAEHLWHLRKNYKPKGKIINCAHKDWNTKHNIIRPINGLKKLEES